MHLSARLLAFYAASFLPLIGGTPTSTILTTSPAVVVIFGRAVKLVATVSPSSATGHVTFYDGASILGVASLSAGQATLSTTELPFGSRSLRSRYIGDAVYAPSLSSAVSEQVKTLPQTGFLPPITYGTLGEPYSMAIGDFNGDGHADVATTDLESEAVSVYSGVGDGTFRRPIVTRGIGVYPGAVAVGDFNGDGRLDMAVTNFVTLTIGILLGNGDGTFQPAINYPAYDSNPGIVVADFNGDGRADLAVPNEFHNTMSVMLGNGDGTFQPAVDFPAGNGPSMLIAGDFNGDGNADLAAQTINSVSVMLGNGDGTFRAPVAYRVGDDSMAVGDLNGNGRLDIVTADLEYDCFQVLIGNGDGTFRQPVCYSSGTQSDRVAIGDFNGDGKADIVGSDSTSVLTLLFGNGDGTFGPPALFRGGTTANLFVGSFGSNGRSDLGGDGLAGDAVTVSLGVPGAPPLSITATAGTSQSGTAGTDFPVDLQVRITDADGHALGGLPVVFTAPKRGSSGTFPNGRSSATAVTDAKGYANAPVLKADHTPGDFVVMATSIYTASEASFNLTIRQ